MYHKIRSVLLTGFNVMTAAEDSIPEESDEQ